MVLVMKKENRMDPMAKSPDPDDLTSLDPAPPSSQRTPESASSADRRANPDVSEPHLPPPDDLRSRVRT